jgi:tetratricopeptide (TPR) repeat protein
MQQGAEARKQVWLIQALIAAVVIAAFGYSIAGQFVGWDDNDLIVNNRRVNPPTVTGFAELWRGPDHEMYIPVIYTVWWSLSHIPAAPNPVIFHATNVLLHLLSACIVFQILRMLLNSRWAACAGAIVFAAHPIQTEAVAWATGLKDVLSGFLAILTIWLYLLARERRSTGRLAAATLVFIFALLAKPSTVCVPIICGIFELYLTQRSPEARRQWRRLSLLAGWLAISLVIVHIAGKVQPLTPTLLSIPLLKRPLIAADSMGWYVQKILWPVGFAIDYSRTPGVAITAGWAPYVLVAVTSLIVVLAALRRWLYLAALLIFIAALLPVSGLKPFIFQTYSDVADRYVYLAMLGPALAVAASLDKVDPRKWGLLAGAVAAVLIVLSVRQTAVWHDTVSLFDHTLEVNPVSRAALRSLGFYWAKNHDDAQAAAYFEKANTLYPDDATNHFNYGNLYLRHGLIDQALSHYQRAVEIDPHNASYVLNYGLALLSANRPNESLAAFKKASELDPMNADAYQNTGLLLEQMGELDAAKHAFTEALRVDPSRKIPREHLDRLNAAH